MKLGTKVAEYLLAGGREREQAFWDLKVRFFFANTHGVPTTEAEQFKILEKYLHDNPRNFCGGGINRFRAAIDMKVPDRNPNHRDAVTWDEVREGDVLCFMSNGRDPIKLYVKSKKVDNTRTYFSPKALDLMPLDGNYYPRFLGDLGLVPYPHAAWNSVNYCLKIASIAD